MEEFKKIKGVEVFSFLNSSGSNTSGEDKMMACLKETFHITGKRSEKVQIFFVLSEH
jgi:hypothetical protein